MKSIKLNIVIAFFILAFASCSTDNYETYEEVELQNEPVVEVIDNPLAFSTARGEGYVLEGLAYETKNMSTGESLFTIASEDVIVECPGAGASSFGGDVFFIFQFITIGEGSLTFSGRLVAEIDGKLRYAFYLPLPDCDPVELSTEYTIEDGRISGQITGEYYYHANELIEPYDSCENFISTGELTVNFDLPLIVCN